jgi:Uma2 family endonuclease
MQTVIIDRSKEWTVEDYLLLGEMQTPCQLINGELIMSPAPTPYHQRISRHLFKMIDNVAEKEGELFFSPIDIYLDKRNVFQPDLVFVSNTNKPFITERGIEGAPDLIVEIISPSNGYIDRNRKKEKYLEFGVKEYWIVDPGNKTIEVYTPETGLDSPLFYLAEEGEFTSKVLPLTIKLSEIF